MFLMVADRSGTTADPANSANAAAPKWSAPAGSSPNRGCRQFGKRTRKPNSVPDLLTNRKQALCGHSSRRRVAADTHQRPTRRFRHIARAALPHRADAQRPPGSWHSALPSLFGLAPCGVYPASVITAGAVRSYRTFSPLPDWPSRQSPFGPAYPRRSAGSRRYVFCGTGRPRALTPTSRTLSGTLPCGVRTFLSRNPCSAQRLRQRPPGPPASL